MPFAKNKFSIPLPPPPVETMAAILSGSGVDLGDERACIRQLMQSNFLADEIVAGLDAATDRARELRATANGEIA